MPIFDRPLILAALSALALAGCASDGAIIGGAAGGTAGAVIGDETGLGTVEGALIGGAAGAIVGDEIEEDDDEEDRYDPDRG